MEQGRVVCTKCGKDMVKNKFIVLTSYPEQYLYECECGFKTSVSKEAAEATGTDKFV